MTAIEIGYLLEPASENHPFEIQAISKRLCQAGVKRVITKLLAPGDVEIDLNQVAPLTATLKDAGLTVWGWQQLLGEDSEIESNNALVMVRNLNLDGFVVHAENKFEQPGMGNFAQNYMRNLRSGLFGRPIALSSFSLPSLHPHFPWKEFLAEADVFMPLLIWSQDQGAEDQLARCIHEIHSTMPSRAIIPTVRFTNGNGRHTNPEILQGLMQSSRELNLKQINLWGGDFSIQKVTDQTLDVVPNIVEQKPPKTRDIIENYFAGLNNANPSEVASLYASKSVLVTSIHTHIGRESIKQYYQDLLSKKLPGAFFDLTSSSGAGNTRNFRWRARPRLDIFKKSIQPMAPKGLYKFTDEHKIFKGIHFKKRALNSPRYHVVHVARIDLNEPGIDLMVTPHNGLGRTASNFLDANNVQMAINGDEWLSWRNPKGLAVSEGIVYSAASSEPTIYISKENQVQFGGDPPPELWNAISGSHTLVRKGEMASKLRRCSKPEVYCQYRAPRTTVAITADNKLIMIVVQGPNGSLRNALSLKELAALNLEFGAVEAINMDGGGSSTMAVDNFGRPQVVNSPSDGSERGVSNHLGVFARYLEPGNGLIVDDGNDTVGLLDGKIVYHYTSYSLTAPQVKFPGLV